MASLGGSEFVFLCAGSMVSLALMGDGWGTWDPSNSFSSAALCHPCAACMGAAWGVAVSMAGATGGQSRGWGIQTALWVRGESRHP